MRVLVFGVGAIGSLMVHYLCKAGNDVTVVARSTYEELKQGGVEIRHYLQKKTTVDHPHVLKEADDTHYDIVLSVMQGQQQVALLPVLAKVDTDLLVLVGNNMETDICDKELRNQNVIYGFQGSAGRRENGTAVVGRLPITDLTIGRLYEPADPEDIQKIKEAFRTKGYKVTPVDSMYAYYMYHIAEIMPYCFLCYHVGCDLKKAGKKDMQMITSATKECFDYLKGQGIPVMPPEEDAYYEKGVRGKAMYLLYRIMGKTVLGRLMVSDHCENGIHEMAYLDRRFEDYRSQNPGAPMPVWDEMREWAKPAFKNEDSKGGIMKADYKNWVPKGMIYGFAAGTGVLAAGYAVTSRMTKQASTPVKIGTKAILGVGAVACGTATAWSVLAHRKFSYEGKRQLSKQIIDGTARYIILPEGGVGLDVGCGSGALTIACAKNNEGAKMVGIDRWGKEYASFSQKLCEDNAVAEGVSNTSFEHGDAVHLEFDDESFDAVTSNYVYHNVVGEDKQKLLLETLRVLKKGGCFAIHDIMSKSRYGDMQEFVKKLKSMGFEDVKLIATDDGLFMSKTEAKWMGLTGSTLLVGKK